MPLQSSARSLDFGWAPHSLGLHRTALTSHYQRLPQTRGGLVYKSCLGCGSQPLPTTHAAISTTHTSSNPTNCQCPRLRTSSSRAKRFLSKDTGPIRNRVCVSAVDASDACGANEPLDQSLMFKAAREGNVKGVVWQLNGGACVNARMHPHGPTALHLAVDGGHTDVVKKLIEMEADVNIRDDFGATPLYSASAKGHLHIVQLLLAAKANVNQARHFGLTPLHVASRNGHTPVVEVLVAEGANVHQADYDDETPLYLAALHGHEAIVNKLLDAGANVDRLTNKLEGYNEAMAFLHRILEMRSTSEPLTPTPSSRKLSPLTHSLPFSAATMLAALSSFSPSHSPSLSTSQPARLTTSAVNPADFPLVSLSCHPSQLPFAQRLASQLTAAGILTAQPPPAGLTPSARCAQWFPAAETARVVVCVVCDEYLRNEECCDEFNTARNLGKLFVVLSTPPPTPLEASSPSDIHQAASIINSTETLNTQSHPEGVAVSTTLYDPTSPVTTNISSTSTVITSTHTPSNQMHLDMPSYVPTTMYNAAAKVHIMSGKQTWPANEKVVVAALLEHLQS